MTLDRTNKNNNDTSDYESDVKFLDILKSVNSVFKWLQSDPKIGVIVVNMLIVIDQSNK